MRTWILLSALVAPLAAQTVTLPAPAFSTTNNDVPFASGIGRYQQWFSLAQLQANFGLEPIRIDRIQVLAGSSGALTTSIDLDVAMSHGPAFGVNSQFDSNLVSGRQEVLSRRLLTMVPAGPGQPCLTINFSSPFTWDGQRPIVVEVRVHGNGRGNAPFNYDLRATATATGSTTRVYQGGNPNAPTGFVTSGFGLYLAFNLRQGAATHFGSGCRGFNFITPTCETLTLASPGILWTHQIDDAASQALCVLALGDSRTQWDTVALPFDLTQVFGSGGSGCALLVNPLLTVFTTTIGSPGASTAQVTFAVPPITDFVGVSLYSQWLVADPSAVNGAISATDGLWSIVAPFGG
ncbi:MAG: hypothetical protein AB7O97_02275 [Planctomycetota bacterium]